MSFVCNICGEYLEDRNLDEESYSPFFACCVACADSDVDDDGWVPDEE
jgi:hypothetical protein